MEEKGEENLRGEKKKFLALMDASSDKKNAEIRHQASPGSLPHIHADNQAGPSCEYGIK